MPRILGLQIAVRLPVEVTRYREDRTWWAYSPLLEVGAGGPTPARAVAALERELRAVLAVAWRRHGRRVLGRRRMAYL